MGVLPRQLFTAILHGGLDEFAKQGMGRAWVDFNSGWNWPPTNHGCSESSTHSTKVPSGDWPLTISPAFSRCPRYLLFTS